MWPLLVLSIISLACIFERFLFWINLNKQNNLLINYILENFEDKKNSEIFIKKLKSKVKNPYAKLTIQIINFKSTNLQEFNESINSLLSNIDNNLNKYGNIFGLTINISPLLGLLGTVFGLINSFSFIDIGNVGVNAEEVTGGISEALISTAAGLIIAIFTLIFSNYFKSIKNKQLKIMNEFCGKFETLYSSKNF